LTLLSGQVTGAACSSVLRTEELNLIPEGGETLVFSHREERFFHLLPSFIFSSVFLKTKFSGAADAFLSPEMSRRQRGAKRTNLTFAVHGG